MVNPIYAAMPRTVFSEMSELATEFGAINLGQGFPDDPGPESVRAKAAEAVLHGDNQYPPMSGLASLRKAVAAHYAARQGLDLDWAGEVTVTSGATEALAATFLGLISPGDEVIVLQPAYDSYAPVIRQAAGIPRFVNLAPPDWRLDIGAIRREITPRTRLIVLNNPMNPTGAVMSDADLGALAELCVTHDLIAVCDEVWEEVVAPGVRHRPLMALPGMRERCVKIGSAGKMFGLTGWKVGWMCAAPALTHAILRAHQFLTYTTPPNLQAAVAWGLEHPADWFDAMLADLARSRARLTSALEAQGFVVLPGEGTYFLNIDLAASGVDLDDRTFCLRAVREAGVAAIPVSAFYEEAPVRHVVRLCFAKGDAVLDGGAERLGVARTLSVSAS
jgi:N-succinyldiaminopimelate aminotransferase